jgi:hypothetical protein
MTYEGQKNDIERLFPSRKRILQICPTRLTALQTGHHGMKTVRREGLNGWLGRAAVEHMTDGNKGAVSVRTGRWLSLWHD